MDDIGNSQLGTRHRAALGLSSKVQDALVIIISEETGWISAAFAGRLYLNLSLGELEDWINRFGEQLKDAGKFRWAWLRGGGWRSSLTNLVTAVGLSVIAWLIVVYQTNPPQQAVLQGVPLVLQGPSQGLVVMEELPETVNVLVRTTRDRIEEFSASSVRAVIDLEQLPAGSYSVPVEARTSDPNLGGVTVKPAAFDVTLESELSQEISPAVRITDLESLPAGYLVDEVVISPPSVTVTGPQSLLERLSDVQLMSLQRKTRYISESSIPPPSTGQVPSFRESQFTRSVWLSLCRSYERRPLERAGSNQSSTGAVFNPLTKSQELK
jgi:hypothetical protein